MTSRHVLHDEAGKQRPELIEIERHDDTPALAHSTAFSISIYRDGCGLRPQGDLP